jgi:hypothetical protein
MKTKFEFTTVDDWWTPPVISQIKMLTVAKFLRDSYWNAPESLSITLPNNEMVYVGGWLKLADYLDPDGAE